jgi:hypothetical protein
MGGVYDRECYRRNTNNNENKTNKNKRKLKRRQPMLRYYVSCNKSITRERFAEISKTLENYPCELRTELYYEDWCKIFFIVFTTEDESEIRRSLFYMAQIPGVNHVHEDTPGRVR